MIEVKSITKHPSTKIRLYNRIPNISSDNDFIAGVKHPKHSPRFDISQWYILCIHIYIYTHYDPWPLPKSFHVSHIANQQKQETSNKQRRFLKHFITKNKQKPTSQHLEPKPLGIPTPSLSKSKQSMQFTRFLLFTSVCRYFLLNPKNNGWKLQKGWFRKGIWLFSRGSIFRLGGVKVCGSISWKFLLEKNMESELEIVGGYCWDMFVRIPVLPLICQPLLMRMSYVKSICKHGEPMVEPILQELGSF